METIESRPADGQYFAFVESVDELPSKWEGQPPPGWNSVLRRRSADKFPSPTHVLWLDCVRRDYFLELPWRDEECRIGDVAQATKLRERLQHMDHREFAVALVLLNAGFDKEDFAFREFLAANWHTVSFLEKPATPVSLAADFEVALESDTPQIRYLHYEAECTGDLLRQLRNVFSLNFLPDAKFDEGENSPPFNKAPTRYSPERKQDSTAAIIQQKLGYQAGG